jgi:hypothetical protein
VPRNTLFSRRQLRIAMSVCGIRTCIGAAPRRRTEAKLWTMP